MAILILEAKVKFALDDVDARAIHRALGEMSVNLWRQAGVTADDMRSIDALYVALDNHFKQ